MANYRNTGLLFSYFITIIFSVILEKRKFLVALWAEPGPRPSRLLQQGHERRARQLARLAVGEVGVAPVGVQEVGAAEVCTQQVGVIQAGRGQALRDSSPIQPLATRAINRMVRPGYPGYFALRFLGTSARKQHE